MLKYYAELGSEPAWGDDNKTDEGRQKMTDKMVEKFTREGVDDYWFQNISAALPKWRKIMQSEQRRNAAKSRWQKKSKNSLDENAPPQK